MKGSGFQQLAGFLHADLDQQLQRGHMVFLFHAPGNVGGMEGKMVGQLCQAEGLRIDLAQMTVDFLGQVLFLWKFVRSSDKGEDPQEKDLVLNLGGGGVKKQFLLVVFINLYLGYLLHIIL